MNHHARLASSFGTAAAAYAEHRPDYAPAAVRWALTPAPGPRVLDLGAGTGKLTTTLTALGADVTAVEPDPAMLAELRRALPAIRAVQGTAEAIPLPDASVDAVLAGNAMHWFDLPAAAPELARILTPGGIVAGLWNVLDDRIPWITTLKALSGPAAIGPRDTLTTWRTATNPLRLPTHFTPPDHTQFPHTHPRTAASLTATLATRAGILTMDPQERESTLNRINTFLTTNPETAGEFALPMHTGVLRFRKL